MSFILLQKALKLAGAAWPLDPQLWQGLRGLVMGLFVAMLMPWLLVRLGLLAGAGKPVPESLAETAA
ncbi:hypothetical protein D3C72_2474080 [compost metagenome]